MNLAAIYHKAKSNYAYSFDKETIHIRLRTAKDDIESIQIKFGDPFYWGPTDHDPHTWEWKSQHSENAFLKKEFSTEHHDYWFIELKPEFRRVKYAFFINQDDQELLYGSRGFVDLKKHPDKKFDLFYYFNFPFLNEIDIFKTPKWAKDTIWYQIFPERFNNGDKTNDPEGTIEWGKVKQYENHFFFGGDLQGVTEKLDYIKDLGINGIYFTPIFKSPSAHKYDTEDYYAIDPQFGDIETLRLLIKEAHKRGIKVMLDAVFNHCGDLHPYWQDVLKNKEKSIYKDYFHIHKFPLVDGDLENYKHSPGETRLNFDTFAFTHRMPKWNTEHPDVKKYLLDIATFWIRECDIDGWRLDVSNEVDHAFWREFRKVVDQEKNDFFILGENWDESTPWLSGEQFSSVMNYQFTFPVWSYLCKDEIDAVEFMNSINSMFVTYPKNVQETLFNQLDTHDTPRLLHLANENKDKAKLAYLFQMTHTGTPSIYYGGEIGLTGKHDPDNRRCMIWEEEKQDKDMYQYIKHLISLRKSDPLMTTPNFKWIDTNPSTNHIVYKKYINNEELYVVINNKDSELNIDTPSEMMNKQFVDLFTNKEITLGNQINIDKYSFLLIKKI